MVKSTIYKGIEFVRLSSLTRQEQDIFNKNFNRHALIKILVGEEVISDCIQYKDYALWYRNSFAPNSNENHAAKSESDSISEMIEVH
jgi:hypothetical protein